MKEFKRVLIANRGEIAIRIIRAVQELGFRAISIYCEEDKLSLFRDKADEAYLISGVNSPTDAYLNIEKIIEIAKSKNIDAIHPGYGFLSENPIFAKECEKAGIAFIGPTSEVITLLGNKVNAKNAATGAGVPVIEGKKIKTFKEAISVANKIGYPVMIKASAGGGGRGMRVCYGDSEVEKSFEAAKREALKAFGDDEMFVEKYLKAPRHIEVQILGDKHGNIVHLYERDCSIQRRHQKIIEFAPSLSISEETRKKICSDAVKIAKHVGYTNAGTVEFLIDKDENHYFIEVNPRIQVEHTVTELICNFDLVQAQILIAMGLPLNSEEIGITSQDSISIRGCAIECRVTTENVLNNFLPDTGRIDVYKTGSGPGVRLDGGNGFTGSIISPYFDSLLVKTTTYDRTFDKTRRKMIRALKEHDIQGVSTNKDFLINVLQHENFKSGNVNTTFIDSHPELFNLASVDNQEYKLLKYIGEVTLKKEFGDKPTVDMPQALDTGSVKAKLGTKQILEKEGASGLVKWIKNQEQLLFTDTTMRDAHQSLFATRMRTNDLEKIAEGISKYESELFSLELWGGATFDTCYNFLKESPWKRLDILREKIPNVLFQMLIRGANGVGYKNYPDNVVREFIKESAISGIDVFRIFDSLNWMEQIKVSCDEVLKQGKVAEVAICYTGDILDKNKTKYNLDYYVRKAREVEKMGAHILAIKDMSGLLKPAAAGMLATALKDEVSIPIHFHTHDTSGNGVSSMLMASLAGVDIVDGALFSMSGVTSQPALNAMVAAIENTPRESKLNLENLQKVSNYFEKVRSVYDKFESGLKTGTTQIYKYEVPGGQYSNLKAQVDSFGLGHRFEEVLDKYKDANELLGDIVKVTPSSKVVGDLSIFMLQNDLTKENIYEKGKDLAFPNSVIDFFKGNIGQPEGGFDEKLRKVVLKGISFINVRPGELLEDEDFDKIKEQYQKDFGITLSKRALTSAALYPKVFKSYVEFLNEYGNLSSLESSVFFYGLKPGEEVDISLEEGKRKVIKLINISEVDQDGFRHLTFEINGFRREIYLEDKQTVLSQIKSQVRMANANNPKEIGSPIPGTVIKIMVEPGQIVKKNQSLMIVEAMKMETEIVSNVDGVILNVNASTMQSVKAGELLIELS